MRDLLVRYLLGELNSQEQEQLEAQLRDSPEMRRELEYLRACLPGGDGAERPQPDDAPTGLSERTLGRICGDERGDQIERSRTEVAAAYDPPAGTPSWSLADLTVAGGVFLAISMLFLPALRQSRDAARRTDCANNLHELGTMLISFSERNGGYFPTPAQHENAGIFAVYLLEAEGARPDQIARLLLCRSSALAQQVAEKRVVIRVPSMAELEAATAKQRCMWKKFMSGSYAGPMGYVQDGQYHEVCNKNSCHKELVADAPSQELGNRMSANHGGCGWNVLYQDGHVCFRKKSTLSEPNSVPNQDEMFLNDAGEEAAGLGPDDTVLGRSDARPEPVKRVDLERVDLERAR